VFSPELRAAHKERVQLARDKWWLAAIILERFVTRLFTEKFELLPGWAKFLDYPMLLLFAAYVIYTTRQRPATRTGTGFGVLIFGFIFIVAISSVANLERLHLGAAGLFVVNLLEPLAFMGLAYTLAPKQSEEAKQSLAEFLVKILLFVGWLQIAVVLVLDLPTFLVTRNPDVISGTFAGNAYQLTFFLLTWNVLILSKRRPGKLSPPQLLGILLLQALIIVIILLAQFRSILPFAALTWVLTYFLVSHRPSTKIVGVALGVPMMAVLFLQVGALFPELRLEAFQQLSNRTDEIYQSGKVQSVVNFTQLISEQPQVILVGTGPGTYASRGFQTFSIVGRRDLPNQLYREYFRTDYYVTDVAARYTLPVANLFAFGSATAAVPWFSYLAIPAELGIVGLLMVLAIYISAIRYCWKVSWEQNVMAILARWVLIGMVLLLQMAFLENWLEVSRVTVPVWLVFGVVLAHAKNRTATSQVTPVTASQT
jgi:hypothetical protein